MAAVGPESCFLFVYMPSLEQCELPALAETPTSDDPAALDLATKPSVIESHTNATPATVVRARKHWRPSMRRLIVLACIVLGMRIFVGEASVVPTASMEGTILVGDHLFMDKLLYGPEIPLVNWRLPFLKTIHRGDIIVFRYPKDVSETFLKRRRGRRPTGNPQWSALCELPAGKGTIRRAHCNAAQSPGKLGTNGCTRRRAVCDGR
jgi:hypothetical protein